MTWVLLAGPPRVMTDTETKTLKEAMNCMITTNSVVGERSGRVILLNLSQEVAPSISAAS